MPSSPSGASAPSRRALVAGALAALPAIAQAQGESGDLYEYLFVDLAPSPGVPVRQTLDAYAAQARRDAGPGAAGEVLGVFAPQIGWKSNEAAVLVRWAAGRRDDALLARLTGAPAVRSSRHDTLRPTARPATGDRPKRGGIFTHRWFVIAPGDMAEFVRLSLQAWPGFEGGFNTGVYGLFRVERSPEDLRNNEQRMLLMTQYASHGEWENSRSPAPNVRDAFARRQALTRSSWVDSCLLL